jgi:pyridoxal phosphate enzyme (YggS family)
MRLSSKEMVENLARLRDRIERAAARAGRRAAEITLVAVSKTHSARAIRQFYDAGVRHFGENRIQEAETKFAPLAGLSITWHMIGHVQKNKAARAAQHFGSVDSVDSVALAEKLDRAKAQLVAEDTVTAEKGRMESRPIAPKQPLRVLIEVRLDPTPAKSGAAPEEVARLVKAVQHLPNLNLCGLMGIPPYLDDPESARPYFRRLRELRDALRVELGAAALPVLSMGMSHDFEIAIEEGATEIRVGTALFGEREEV